MAQYAKFRGPLEDTRCKSGREKLSWRRIGVLATNLDALPATNVDEGSCLDDNFLLKGAMVVHSSLPPDATPAWFPGIARVPEINPDNPIA